MKDDYVSIGLVNPKSPSNVGAVMRAAGCYRVDDVCYTGVRYDRAAKFATDTKQVAQRVPLQGVEDIVAAAASKGVSIVCVELVEGAVSLPYFKHPDRALYIFGPEDGTISQQVVDRADSVVYVPTIGCMNLAATVNVLLYDRLAKKEQADDSQFSGDELIRNSRDTNNKVSL